MTLNSTSGSPFMKRTRNSLHGHHCCKHPPPVLHRHHFSGFWFEFPNGDSLQISLWLRGRLAGVIGCMSRQLARPPPIRLRCGARSACPFRLPPPGGRRRLATLLARSGTSRQLASGRRFQNGIKKLNSTEGGFAYAKYDCFISSSRGIEEWK